MTRRHQPPSACNPNTNDELIDVVLARLDHLTTLHMSSSTPQVDATPTKNSGTYTITQILSGLVVIITLSGSLIGAWVSINNQLATQKVSTELIIDQMKKDLESQKTATKDTEKSIADTKVEIASSFKELMQHVEQLDNSINQIYNRVNK